MKRLVHRILAMLLAPLVILWRLSIRVRVVDDPRPTLTVKRQPYAYALLHAHQASAVLAHDGYPMAAMVSRSADGDLLVPTLRLLGIKAVRGSTRKGGQDKGGREALGQLVDLVRQGVPALLAVDAPRGPRGHVHRGVADLSLATGAPILPVVVVAAQRWILARTWDRTQIPKPFSALTLAFGDPLAPVAAETSDALRERVAQALRNLEWRYDAEEARRAETLPG